MSATRANVSGDGAHRVLRQERGQPDGLVAHLATDRVFGVRGEVALVEQQVDYRAGY